VDSIQKKTKHSLDFVFADRSVEGDDIFTQVLLHTSGKFGTLIIFLKYCNVDD
jgi:hypothetical protein